MSIVEAYPALRGDVRPTAGVPLPSDHDLVDRMADGDQSGLRELMRRHRSRVQRFVGRMIRDRDLADDVINDTFVAAWRQAGSYQQRASVVTWLLAIAKNRALTARNGHRRNEEALDDAHACTIADHSDTPDVVVERKDGAKMLRKLTAMLSANQAELIDLFYYHEKSVREVAKIVGIPDNTVKTRMLLARRRLALLLAAEGIHHA